MKLKTPKSAPPPLLALICRALDEKKAGDIRVLCVRSQSSITDYLVLGTGTSEPHLRALRVELEKIIDQEDVRILGMDTGQASGWLVVDAFDIMVHVFTPENRRKYALESLWKDAEELSLASVLGTEKQVKALKVPKVLKTPKPQKTTKVMSAVGASKKPPAPKTARASTKPPRRKTTG